MKNVSLLTMCRQKVAILFTEKNFVFVFYRFDIEIYISNGKIQMIKNKCYPRR